MGGSVKTLPAKHKGWQWQEGLVAKETCSCKSIVLRVAGSK